MRKSVLPGLLRNQDYDQVANLMWCCTTLTCHGQLAMDWEMFAEAEPLLAAYLHCMPMP